MHTPSRKVFPEMPDRNFIYYCCKKKCRVDIFIKHKITTMHLLSKGYREKMNNDWLVRKKDKVQKLFAFSESAI